MNVVVTKYVFLVVAIPVFPSVKGVIYYFVTVLIEVSMSPLSYILTQFADDSYFTVAVVVVAVK